MNEINRICYVGGCGRLGLSLAAWSAHRGFDVVVSDVNAEAVAMVNSGKCPISEPSVQQFVSRIRRATTNTIDVTSEAHLIFIIVPTPSLPSGEFSIQQVHSACQEVGAGLKKNPGHPTVVIVSTVNPGNTRNDLIPALELFSGKKAVADFTIAYSPEFIRQGSIIKDFANPDQILVGTGFANDDITPLIRYYQRVVVNDPEYNVISYESAEIAKLGLNAALATKVAVANQLMWLCQHTPNADAEFVLGSVGSDSRIGQKFFKPGLWVGGPCLPRDNIALHQAIKKAYGIPVAIALSIGDSMQEEKWALAELAYGHGERIGVLGLTYKAGVDIVEDSPGYQLAEYLHADRRGSVMGYDPVVTRVDAPFPIARSMGMVIDFADVLVITTPWDLFRGMLDLDLRDKTVIDCWGLFDEERYNFKYIRLGRGKHA